jgi:PAS domain-containing protein
MSAAAEILQSSEEIQFSSLLKHAPVGLALCQSAGNVTSRNSAFDELLGVLSSQIPCSLPELIRDEAGSRQLTSELFQGNEKASKSNARAGGPKASHCVGRFGQFMQKTAARRMLS